MKQKLLDQVRKEYDIQPKVITDFVNKQKAKELKTGILIADILMWSAFIMMIAARVLTLFYLSAISNETKADIEAINNLYEQSQLNKVVLGLTQFGTLFQVLIIPATTMATYLFFRHRVKKGLTDLQAFNYLVTFTFFIVLLDIVNNLALLLGRMV